MLNLKKLYSEESFEEVFRLFYAPLCGFANKLINSKDEAEDIVQEVLSNIWEQESTFENIAIFRSYLYKAVRNKCANYLRANSVRFKYAEQYKEEEAEENILNQMIKEEVYRQLMLSLEELPEQRRRIYLMYLEGVKGTEIAESLDLSIETVRTQIKRAKKTLKEKLGKITYLLIVLLFI